MKNKTFLIFVLGILVFISFLQFSMAKIDSSVIDQVNSNGFAKVYVSYNNPPQKNLMSLFSSKKTNFKVKVMNVNSSELSFLENQSNVTSIALVPEKHILDLTTDRIINATPVWNVSENGINLTGKGQTVCIIDTGVDYTNPSLGGCYGYNNLSSPCKVIGGWDFCADNSTCTTQDDNVMDANGHGTHVAGILSGNGSIKGVAPDSKIVVLKVFNSTGSAWDNDILSAMDWCIKNATEFNISAISMSLGGNKIYSTYCDNDSSEDNYNFSQEIASAEGKNISVVIATGNDNSTLGVSSPACIKDAIRVGASYNNDSIVNFTNRGGIFSDTLLAPGVDVNSTMPPNSYLNEYNKTWGILSGTSMATPHVAGAILLLNQYRKESLGENFAPQTIKSKLIDFGKKINDTLGTLLNYSRIDVFSTLIGVDSSPPEVSLLSPANNTLSNGTIDISCYAKDDLNKINLTLNIWNSTGLFNSTNQSFNSLNGTINENFTLPLNEIYSWGCSAIDSKGNIKVSKNRTFSTVPLLVKTISPQKTYVNTNQTYNCSANSVSSLRNLTFYFWGMDPSSNSSNMTLLNNQTVNISGVTNSSVFNYNFSRDGNYTWSCSASNVLNQTYNSNNKSIISDTVNPNVTRIFPSNNYSVTGEQNIKFKFNVSEQSNCSVVINEGNNYIKSYPNKINIFTKRLGVGNYEWYLNCSDLTGNLRNTSNYLLTIKRTPTYSGGSGGSSSYSPTVAAPTPVTTPKKQVKEINSSDLSSWNYQNLSNNTNLVLNLLGKTYNISASGFNSSEFSLNISNKIYKINNKSDLKIDLNEDHIYDLEVIYSSSSLAGAQVYLKKINEVIPVKHIETNKPAPIKTIKQKTNFHGFIQKIVYTIFKFIKEKSFFLRFL